MIFFKVPQTELINLIKYGKDISQGLIPDTYPEPSLNISSVPLVFYL